MLDFVTKPWAQKTYSLATNNAMPVSQKAATVVASKIPGGNEALRNYVSAERPLDKPRIKARIFRDPARYDIISDALLDTIYDIQDGTVAEGSTTTVREVVVTGVTEFGFFAQEADGGAQSGVYVYTTGIALGLTNGDRVSVWGCDF